MLTRSHRSLALTGALLAACSADPQSAASPEPSASPLAPLTPAPASASAPAPSAQAEASPPRDVPLAPGVTVHIEPRGPSLIAVSVEAKPDAPPNWTVDLERYDEGSGPAKETLSITHPKSVHSAKPGAEYLYRFRFAGGPPSDRVIVRTAVPARPPAARPTVTARAVDPFTTELAMKSEAHDAAGLEIEVTSARGTHRAAIVDPDARSFTHRARRPGEKYAYRVRAFNAAGPSAWSEKAEITVPKLSSSAPFTTTLPACMKKLPPEPPGASGAGRTELRPAPDELLHDPDKKDPTKRHLIGRAKGCLRPLGDVQAQADITVLDSVPAEPLPLLSVLAGAGEYAGAQLVYLRFDGAAYAKVHEVLLCGEPYPIEGPSLTFGFVDDKPDPRGSQPPFESCQLDNDL